MGNFFMDSVGYVGPIRLSIALGCYPPDSLDPLNSLDPSMLLVERRSLAVRSSVGAIIKNYHGIVLWRTIRGSLP